ncbi:uncharacterized protein LOC130913275 [Corythoichthys intestinalis]|uniref:uncharacterized protein LOC130913275 n=1 Tax=Corythoichthys intestinalis TaxID=161448 RepID=UPI0025A6799B|nr:uncharacterized protein LOC130913275 [Corythoichthys intestinalis]
MSEGSKTQNEHAPQHEKRVPKMTEKALINFIEKCQVERQSQCKKATASMENLKVLMDAVENVSEVQTQLNIMMKCLKDAQENHDSLLKLNIPPDQAALQNQWFEKKRTLYFGFMEKVKAWLCDVGQPREEVFHNDPIKDGGITDQEEGARVQDSLKLGDSASVLSSNQSQNSKSSSTTSSQKASITSSKQSQKSKSSSTTSSQKERIKAEAEKAALIERVAALKRMHQLEVEEQNLRRQKEQLALETELAAFNAKINVFEENASLSSRSSYGRSSKVLKANANILNPGAAEFCPKERKSVIDCSAAPPLVVRPKERRTVVPDDSAVASSLVVRPKERRTAMIDDCAAAPPLAVNINDQIELSQPNYDGPFIDQKPHNVYNMGNASQVIGLPAFPAQSGGHRQKMPTFQTHASRNSVGHDTQLKPMVHTQSQGTFNQSSSPQAVNQNDIFNIMQRQNDITTLMIQQSLASALPPRQIHIFDGDPLQYHAFMRAFENGVKDKSNNYSDCLHFLEQYTRGLPREIVQSCQHLPPDQGYQRAKNLLMEHFGNEYKISSAYMNKAFSWTPIKREDIKALQAFALFLRGCCNVTEQIQHMKDLDMPSNMRTIVLKLPYNMRERWRNAACDLMEHSGRRVMFSDLVAFIEKQVRTATDPLFGNIQDTHTAASSKSSTPYQIKDLKERKQSSFATNLSASQTSPRTSQCCMFCKKSGHSLDKCTHFKGKLHSDKISFIKEKAICFGCLKEGHVSKDCNNRLECDVCRQKHPGVLHIKQLVKRTVQQVKDTQPQQDDPKEPAITVETVASQTCGHIGAGFEDDCIFSIVPVQVKAKKSDVVLQTYAFLDPGSSGTFCTESLIQRLNMRKRRTNLLLRTLGQEKIIASHVVSGLEVSGLDDNDFIDLPDVVTQTRMPVSHHNIPRQDDVDKWPYLSDVKLQQIDSNIDLLIGTNASKVMEPWEIINSQGDGPYAVRTKVGWVLNGPLRAGNDRRSSHVSSTITANRISLVHIEEMMIQQYNHDFNETTLKEQPEMSREDIKFMDIMHSSSVLKDGHYYLDLPFRNANPIMPNNRSIAEQRLMSLKRKFGKNEVFREEYVAFLTDVIDQGYAEIVPEGQLRQEDGKQWYIPHHGVYHPRKGKLRVVFDCGAMYKGMSLNCQLLQGPDLTNSLIGVLLRFRQESVALMADIQAMFHQVKVSEKDVNFLRFLWWPQGNTEHPPVEYRMTVHLFGAVSSPSCANYALRKTADDHAGQFPAEVVATVKNNFYVDDLLKSLSSEKEAIQMVQNLTALCQRGGFNLSKWISNSRSVLTTIPQENRTNGIKELDLERESLPLERALGLQWCVESDQFMFRTTTKEKTQTRRGILSVVSSLYDPLGFLAPFTLSAKLLLQELCKRRHTWDEYIPPYFSQQWSEWLNDLERMTEFKVNRCFKPKNFGKTIKARLHHFSDASQDGYGTVSYLRLENAVGRLHVAFILAKARVAPLKQTTIPRLELTAAVLAVKLDAMLQKELELKLEKSTFWTDSTTVLKYISNETKRFHTFVANRTAAIREATSVEQWRYIGTKDNPADDVSRGMKGADFLMNKRWSNGPKFLSTSEEDWPDSDSKLQPIAEDDPEIKRDLTANAIIMKTYENYTYQLMNYFSTWRKLKTAVAWFLRVRHCLRLLHQKRTETHAAVCKVEKDLHKQTEEVTKRMQVFKRTLGGQYLHPEDLAKAEKTILCFVQGLKFEKEIATLKSGITLKKDSQLYKLDPVLDDGLLRVGGRVRRSSMPEETKHPIILTKDFHVSTLILRHIHQQLAHGGRNHVLSHLRKKYWITNANSAIRKVISECVTCKRQRGKIGDQKMADLPKERVLPDVAPFTNVGVDYFGPINVKRGRNILKRYGVIFTCLTSRAMHLEVAYSLDTDSCINAVRRFICRRGPVSSIRSDNGTNFVGANRELKEALTAFNHNKMQGALLHEGVTWNFNPPAASHHGGVWERLIRMVRKVLESVLHQQILDDEGLQTVLCEAEAILNSRPITTISEQPDDLEALTPNHILLLKGKPVLPPGLFEKKDLYIRRRWKQVQYMADLFWTRWISEYLPMMQERQKWSMQRRNLVPGDIVVIADATAPRGSWMLGRVVEAKPDARGLVRTVRLQTKTSVLERPVTKLCLLLEATDEKD